MFSSSSDIEQISFFIDALMHGASGASDPKWSCALRNRTLMVIPVVGASPQDAPPPAAVKEMLGSEKRAVSVQAVTCSIST